MPDRKFARTVLLFFFPILAILSLYSLPETLANNQTIKNGIREKYQISDTIFELSSKINPPPSAWIENEKATYQRILQNNSYDVMIVPFQNMNEKIDLTSRKLMTYKLASRIQRRTTLSIAPIHIVYRALGNSSWYYGDKEVYDLAKKLRVKYLIWGFTGFKATKENQQLQFAVIRQECDQFSAFSKSKYKYWEKMDIGIDNLPFACFKKKVDAVVHFLNLPPGEQQRDKNRIDNGCPSFDTMALPATPMELFHEEIRCPIQQAYYFQFLGLLTPVLSADSQIDGLIVNKDEEHMFKNLMHLIFNR